MLGHVRTVDLVILFCLTFPIMILYGVFTFIYFKFVDRKVHKKEDGDYYEFEGLKLFGPKNYDAYLTKIYGDYMTPPDENEKNHHNTELVKEGE